MAASVLNLGALLSPSTLLNKSTPAALAKAQAAATGSSSSTSGTTGISSSAAGSTFLNLLVKELQNQDPTAPMDSTAMVGQMISLNQLDQLISINQVLSTATTATSTTPVAHAVSNGSSTQMAERAALMSSLQGSNALQSASDPNQTLDLSNLNIFHGGK